MKRMIAIILFFGIVVIPFAIFNGHANYPDYIYNYLEHGDMKRLTVNLDNYVVTQKGLNEIRAYNKKTKKSASVGEDVFDFQKDYVSVIFSVGDELYYEARDPKTNTKSVYTFNLDTYDKTKIYSQSGMTDTDGFLGINELLGIYNTYSMDFSGAGKYIVSKNGFMYLRDAVDLLLKKDKENKYNIPTSDMKMAANKNGIYFLNNFNELLFYNYESDDIKRVMEERIENFFIVKAGIYFVPLCSSDKLYKADFGGQNKIFIGKIELKDVRAESDEAVYVSDGNNVYQLVDNKLKYLFERQKDSLWEYDGKILYYYNTSNSEVKEVEIK